jgi:two-component system, NarL family, nitrate/nitrite response regulator NarL
MRQSSDTAIRAMVPAAGPRVAILVDDPWRARQLEAVLDRAEPAAADVLVLDLPEGATLPPLPAVRPLLVLTDDDAIAADRTVAGVLPREAPASRVLAAVHAIAEGLFVRMPPGPAPRLLTAREAEILAQIARGLSNKAIARRLGISAHTVKYHLEAVFSKLGVNSRAEALSQGIQRGLVAL